MDITFKLILLVIQTTASFVIFHDAVYSQIVVDKTNIEGTSTLKTNNNMFEINGGTVRKNSLVHSFRSFNLKKNNTAQFNTSKTTTNIIVRVNGNLKSKLDGTILTNQPINFIFMNPSGIFVGESFKAPTLNSLTLTTASSLDFSDGYRLRSNNYVPSSAKSGYLKKYNFDSKSKDISINNLGKFVKFIAPLIPERLNDKDDLFTGGKQVNIFGNRININGGIIKQKDSTINLFSVNRGSITQNKDAKINKVEGLLNDISLRNHTLIYSDGINGSIDLRGKQVKIGSGSVLYLFNNGLSNNGINIESNQLEIVGALRSSNFILDTNTIAQFSENQISGIYVFNTSSDVANINVNAKETNLLSGGLIVNHGGPISVQSNRLNIDSVKNDFNSLDSSIVSRPSFLFDGMPLVVNSKRVTISNGGVLGSSTISEKNAGPVYITSRNIDINSFNSATNFPSNIASGSFGPGNSSDISITTDTLRILNGAVVSSASIGSGNTGDLLINARQILIKGDTLSPSTGISSIVTPSVSDLSQLPSVMQNPFIGESGNVEINVKDLKLIDGSISVSNLANSQAGNILVSSKNINLKNSAISATSLFGDGDAGNIFIVSGSTLLNKSSISSSSQRVGLGGDITIKSKIISLTQSQISANAQNSEAGSINIEADIISENDSDITANSELGIAANGEISIQKGNEIRLFENIPTIENSVAAVTIQCTNKGEISNHGSGINPLNLSETQRKALDLKQRLEIANQFTYLDHKTGERKPFKRWLGIEKQADGNLELIFSPEQSKTLQTMLSSLDNVCLVKS